jgi:phosphoribosylformylglycinamidine synthase
LADARALGVTTLTRIDIADVVLFDAPLDDEQRRAIVELLVDPLLQHGDWTVPEGGVEIATTHDSTDAVRAAMRLAGLPDTPLATATRYEFVGPIDAAHHAALAEHILYAGPTRRTATLTHAEQHAIAEHFRSLDREPTNFELEVIALVWGDHRSHLGFEAPITLDDGTALAPLGQQLHDCTDRISAPTVRSATGGVGIVSYQPGVTLALASTATAPSPRFDVPPTTNRHIDEAVGQVLAAGYRPVAATDVVCVGPRNLAPRAVPDSTRHPRTVERHIVDEVADFHNTIGVPTVAGAVVYDRAYTGQPLAIVNCIGVANDSTEVRVPHSGDHVVLISGGTPSRAVGRGTAIRSLLDTLTESGELHTAAVHCTSDSLWSALSAFIGEVGLTVDLRTLPTRANGHPAAEALLHAAESISVLSVTPAQWDDLRAVFERHRLCATSIGTFTDDQVLRIHAGDLPLVELDNGFLRHGQPQRSMEASVPSPLRHTHHTPADYSPTDTLLALLRHPTIASKERIIRRFDHEVRGATVVRPVLGRASDAHADGVVVAEPTESHGIAIGVGVNHWYGLLDPERMAHASVDEAIRNVVAVGADPARVSLLAAFNWGDLHAAATVGELVVAVRGCCDAAEHHRAPIVNHCATPEPAPLGGGLQQRSGPSTLAITAVADVPDVERVCTPQLTQAGHVLVHVGRVANEFGGSHYSLVHQVPLASSGVVPAPDPDAPQRYRRLHDAIATGKVRACHDVSEGGLAVALAEMCIAGRLGANIEHLPHPDHTVSFFSESVGRFVCEIATADVPWFLDHMGRDVTVLGEVTSTRVLTLPDVSLRVDELLAAFSGGES